MGAGSTAYLYQKDEFAQDFVISQTRSWEFHPGQMRLTPLEKQLFGLVHGLKNVRHLIHHNKTYLYIDKDVYQTAQEAYTRLYGQPWVTELMRDGEWNRDMRIMAYFRNIGQYGTIITHTALTKKPEELAVLRRVHIPFLHWDEDPEWGPNPIPAYLPW